MQSFLRIFVVALGLVSLSACPNKPGVDDQQDASPDAQVVLDAGIDAAQQQDAEAQQDAGPDAQVLVDASVDAAQQDAEVLIPGEVTYYVSSMNYFPVYQPWWDGTMNTFTEVTIVAGSKDVTVNNINIGLHGTADASDFINMQLVQDGTVIHTPAWVSQQKLSIPLGLVLAANNSVTFELEGRPEWALCKDLSFDIDADTDIDVTTNDNGVAANVTEGATSVTPLTSPVQGMRIELDINTPTGNLVPGVDVPLFIFNIYSTYDVQVREMYYELTINPEMALAYIDDFALWNQGTLINGGLVAHSCDLSYVCEINAYNNFVVPGNCQQYQVTMTADIDTITSPTALAIEAITANWEVVDMLSASMYAPDQLPDAIWSAPLLGP